MGGTKLALQSTMNPNKSGPQSLSLLPMDQPSRAPDVTAQAGVTAQPVVTASAAPPSASHAAIASGQSSARAADLRAPGRPVEIINRERRADVDQPVASAATRRTALTPASTLVPKRKPYAVVGAAIASVVAVAAVVVWQMSGDTPDASPASGAAPATAARTPVVAASKGPAAMTAQAAIPSEPAEDYAAKVEQLKAAGNWNVVVLYASEWTRKRPTEAAAWSTLSQGYMHMRQHDEALDTANRATQVAPSDARAWQQVARINLALQRPVPALQAFEKASTLDERDLASLVQAGLLNVQLGQLAAARTAFDKALAVDPEAIDAVCGDALVAQRQGRMKDADARRLKGPDGKCRDWAGTVSVAVSGAAAVQNAALSPSSPPAARPRSSYQ